MEHLFQLRMTDSLGGTSLLDIGARDTRLAEILNKEGFSKITLLDKNKIVGEVERESRNNSYATGIIYTKRFI
jgi:hypothetical protein